MHSARGKNAWQQLPASPRSPLPSPRPAGAVRGKPPPRLLSVNGTYERTPESPRWASATTPTFRAFRVEPHTPTSPATPIVEAVVAPDSLSISLLEPPEVAHQKRPSLEEALAKAFGELAVKGEVDVALLPAVLAAANVKVEAQVMEEAIRRLVPGAEDGDAAVSFGQALIVAQYLAGINDRAQSSVLSADTAKKTSDGASLGRLLATVIGIMFLCASLAAGLAILWMWLNTTSQNEHYALIELDLNSDMLDVMVHQKFQRQKEQLAREFAQTVGTLVKDMGFRLSSNLGKGSLALTAKTLGRVLDEWWQRHSVQAFNDIALLLKRLVGRLFATVGVNDTARLLWQWNQGMLPGAEVIMGQWSNGNNSAVRYLYPRRFTDQCLNGVCNSVPGSGLPLRMALWGYEGVMRGLDYRPKMVQAAYVYFATLQIGMVFKADLDTLLEDFSAILKAVFDRYNLISQDSSQVLLARNMSDGSKQILTDLTCTPDTDCYQSYTASLYGSNTPISLGLQNQVGLLEVIDYDGDPVIAAYIGVPSIGMGLVVKMSTDIFVSSILANLGQVLETVNEALPGSAELELASFTTDAGGNLVLTNLTAYQSPEQCAGPCRVSPYVAAAARSCSAGVFPNAVDYRGVGVVAGYACLPELNAVATYKVDHSEIATQGLNQAVQATGLMNRNEVDTSFRMLMGKPKGGLSAGDVKSDADVQFLTHPMPECSTNCDGTVNGIAKAFRGFAGILYGLDYRGVDVMAVVKYVSSMGIGLEAKVNKSELMVPIVSKALVLIGINLGCLLVSTVLLALYTRKMVLSMVRAEREGQEAILVEKQRFSSLVESMYPAYVVPRLLAGERSIVQSLPHTAVFFSDIYDFTSTANKISSEELLDLMGYTYGVMDRVADHFCVAKVKTVGDAYLAISGLPGHEGRNCALDMLRFASCIAQVFSCKFDHPGPGEVLVLLQNRPTKKGAISAKGSNASGSKRHSVAVTAAQKSNVDSRNPSTVQSSQATAKSAVKDPYARVPKVRCLMSYGIAAGPVTAGVLQGKNPMFDIWGKTVNLASRMQSTGQPGRIQVSDLFHRSVIASPDQPFLFEDSHQVMCKGFGTVTSYFVKGTSETPPKALLTGLGLRPNLGLYFFENLVPGYRKNPAGPTEAKPAGVGEGPTATKAHERPPPVGPRSPPQKGLRKMEPLVLQDMEDV
eukprot:EG_transcript_923